MLLLFSGNLKSTSAIMQGFRFTPSVTSLRTYMPTYMNLLCYPSPRCLSLSLHSTWGVGARLDHALTEPKRRRLHCAERAEAGERQPDRAAADGVHDAESFGEEGHRRYPVECRAVPTCFFCSRFFVLFRVAWLLPLLCCCCAYG